MPRLCVLLALALPTLAVAGPQRDAVMTLLNAFDTPLTQADLHALGDGVDVELMEIADDSSVPHTRRGRAVSALQYYPTDQVQTYLQDTLEGTDALLRRKAAYSLAVFGPAAVPELTGALASPDVQLRIAAANALGTVGDAAATGALQDRLPQETEQAVIDAIRKSLGAK